MHARLDQVPIAFGMLIKEFQQMIHDDSMNSRPVQIMIDSIELRWAACDQDVCIAVIILHPLYASPYETPLDMVL